MAKFPDSDQLIMIGKKVEQKISKNSFVLIVFDNDFPDKLNNVVTNVSDEQALEAMKIAADQIKSSTKEVG